MPNLKQFKKHKDYLKWYTINLHLGEKFGVEVPPIPSQEQTESYIKSLTE